MSFKLSKRLNKIVEMCDTVDTIIDVGTDHGKVAISIANKGLSKKVIAIDNKEGPLQSCEKNAKLFINNDNVEFKTLLSDGLNNLTVEDKKNELGIIITGIGYDNMKNILESINDYNFKYLILSPHTKIIELIKYLENINIEIVQQETLYDDEKYYYILKAKKKCV